MSVPVAFLFVSEHNHKKIERTLPNRLVLGPFILPQIVDRRQTGCQSERNNSLSSFDEYIDRNPSMMCGKLSCGITVTQVHIAAPLLCTSDSGPSQNLLLYNI